MNKLKRHIKFCCFAAASLAAASCRGAQASLDPAGAQSKSIHDLWWLFFIVCGSIYVIVMLVLVIAFIRSRRDGGRADEYTPAIISPEPRSEKRLSNIIKLAVAITVVVIFVFMVTSFRTGRAIASMADAGQPLVIKVTGHQWWWQVNYQDDVQSNNLVTSNEIHIPVGRPVKIKLESTDVIHSFWVPNLNGKRDAIPGYTSLEMIEADKPGVYWGQCAEFCGHQHAHMRFVVVAEPEADFNNWIAAQMQPSVPPTTDMQKRGQEVFLTTACAQCHTIQGTPAAATVGPNLTHIASRPYIAAGSFENNKGHLGGWILDPQSVKPGAKMPMNSYTSEDLQALLEYLNSLK